MGPKKCRSCFGAGTDSDYCTMIDGCHFFNVDKFLFFRIFNESCSEVIFSTNFVLLTFSFEIASYWILQHGYCELWMF